MLTLVCWARIASGLQAGMGIRRDWRWRRGFGSQVILKYEAYLQLSPTAPDAGEVRKHLRELPSSME
jgi:hypothetical protein